MKIYMVCPITYATINNTNSSTNLTPFRCKILPRPKKTIWGVNRHFQAELVKCQHLHIIKTTASIPSKFLHSDKYHQILVVGGTAAILKKKSKNRHISATV